MRRSAPEEVLDLADAEARVDVLREDALGKVEAAVALLAEGRNVRMPRDAPPELRRAGAVVAPDEPDAPRLEERAPGVRRQVELLALRAPEEQGPVSVVAPGLHADRDRRRARRGALRWIPSPASRAAASRGGGVRFL